MRKIVVINGLARGGTNLAANLLAAQNGWHASDAAIAEIACIDQFLPKDFINHCPKSPAQFDVGAIVDPQIEKFKDRCVAAVARTVCPSYHTIKTRYHAEITSYYGVPISEWGKYMQAISNIEKFDALDSLYLDFAETIGCDVLAHRTTALTSYASTFLSRSDNHYWIEILRDPFDRAVSSRKGHSQCLAQSFLQSKWQLDQIKKITHTNFILIKYEDICTDPRRCVDQICSALGVDCKQFIPSPVTPDMSCFYGNSSKNPDIFNQIPKEIPIYKDSIGGGQALNNRERRLGESIASGRGVSPIYLIILFFADMIYRLGFIIQRMAIVILSLNYIALMRDSGLRKVLQRCVGRFL